MIYKLYRCSVNFIIDIFNDNLSTTLTTTLTCITDLKQYHFCCGSTVADITRVFGTRRVDSAITLYLINYVCTYQIHTGRSRACTVHEANNI